MAENPEAAEIRSYRSWKDVLVADRWRLIGIALVVGAVGAYLGWQPQIPRWLRLFAITAGVAAVLGYPVAARIVAWLYRPNFMYLIDLDARDTEFAIWRLPPNAWRDLQVIGGELFQVQAAAPAWECRGYDPETNKATGTWRGSASDLELVEEQERIDEIRGELQELAQEGLTLRVKLSGIVRFSVRSIVMSFVEGFESESLYDGEQVEATVTKALDHWEHDDRDDGPGAQEPGDDATDAEENVAPVERPQADADGVAADGGTDE